CLHPRYRDLFRSSCGKPLASAPPPASSLHLSPSAPASPFPVNDAAAPVSVKERPATSHRVPAGGEPRPTRARLQRSSLAPRAWLRRVEFSAYPLLNGPISPGKPNGVLHEGIMAFIKTISVREAGEGLRAIYGMIRSDMVGSLPFPVQWTAWNVMQVFSLRPQFLWAFGRGFRHFMWDGE